MTAQFIVAAITCFECATIDRGLFPLAVLLCSVSYVPRANIWSCPGAQVLNGCPHMLLSACEGDDWVGQAESQSRYSEPGTSALSHISNKPHVHGRLAILMWAIEKGLVSVPMIQTSRRKYERQRLR
jgi:hypothetical protein